MTEVMAQVQRSRHSRNADLVRAAACAHTRDTMKFDSKYFDCVRVKQDHAREVHEDAPACQWKGCAAAGSHRAPRGRGREGEYYLLCLDHVRQFNASYNYFAGMSNADIEAYQKDSVTGHRPTWKVGENSWAHGTRHGMAHVGSYGRRFYDPHGFFSWRSDSGQPRRTLRPLELKSLESLNLPATAAREEIKSRFKELVKRHHPDANGGDKRSEDKLREIIQAYNYLKQAGLV
jgi:DnaJ-domain-containing protein 1